ncbi:MAG: M48 family metallopeptidase [Dehalococcoidia bacterium]|nr:M48 family metallopeptidase [Dehalococcoidia bacterium]
MSDLPNEYTQVELPFIEQLKAMGWEHLEGDIDVPYHVGLDGPTPALRLHQGRFMLQRDEIARAQEHFVKWYVHNGRHWVLRAVGLFVDRLGLEPQKVGVRELGFRWGSCGRNGAVNFKWRCALLPPRIIEYIVAHELVHLREPLHSPDFWTRLGRAMPDYEARKQWLAENGGRCQT